VVVGVGVVYFCEVFLNLTERTGLFVEGSESLMVFILNSSAILLVLWIISHFISVDPRELVLCTVRVF
jgi:hypothetical protein